MSNFDRGKAMLIRVPGVLASRRTDEETVKHPPTHDELTAAAALAVFWINQQEKHINESIVHTAAGIEEKGSQIQSIFYSMSSFSFTATQTI